MSRRHILYLWHTFLMGRIYSWWGVMASEGYHQNGKGVMIPMVLGYVHNMSHCPVARIESISIFAAVQTMQQGHQPHWKPACRVVKQDATGHGMTGQCDILRPSLSVVISHIYMCPSFLHLYRLSAAEFTMHLIGRDSTARQSLTTATCLQTAVAISTLTTTASSSNLWAPPPIPLDTSGKR